MSDSIIPVSTSQKIETKKVNINKLFVNGYVANATDDDDTNHRIEFKVYHHRKCDGVPFTAMDRP